MRLDYFEYNGKKYGKYTKLVVNDIYYNEIAVYFLAIVDGKEVSLMCKKDRKQMYLSYPIDKFYNSIVKVYEENGMEELGIKVVTKRDRDIDKLFNGWLWYIVLMFFSTFTNGFVLAWIVISIVFFRWRKKVKKEETYYAKR